MKQPIKILLLALLPAVFIASCKKDTGPSIDDYPLNYTIKDIPVTSDIPVGAYLYNDNSVFTDALMWPKITEPYNAGTGKIGPYVMPVQSPGGPGGPTTPYRFGNSAEGILAMTQMVEWAKLAKIDFLITPAVRENENELYPNNLNKDDSLLVNQFAEHPSALGSVNMGTLKYAISVDINDLAGKESRLSNTNLLENAPTKTIAGTPMTREQRVYNFMQRISHYFSDETYFHTNGRPVLVLIDADKLYSADSKKVYDNIRQTIKDYTGKDVYIIVRQKGWTPSARYEYSFMQGRVDAVSMSNMCNVDGGGNWERTYWLSQLINENFKFNKAYMKEHFGIDFIPSASPSYQQYINAGASPNYNNPPVYKDEKAFRERCNVAKMNLGDNKMVLIESFNRWREDSQIEPTVADYGNGYGTKYLDIVSEEFKLK